MEDDSTVENPWDEAVKLSKLTVEFQNDLSSYDRFAGLAARIKEYVQDHPYCLHSYIALANAYIPLGYPDLAAGTVYKALLLSDAVQDESDEYHEQTTDALVEFVVSLSAEHPFETFAPSQRGSVDDNDGGDDADDKVTSTALLLEQSLVEIYRLLIFTLSACGCYKTAANYYSQANARFPDDVGLQKTYDKLRCAVSDYFNTTLEEVDKNEAYATANWPNSGFVRREIYTWNEYEPDRLKCLANLNHMMAKVAPKLEVKIVNLPTMTSTPKSRDSEVVQQLGVFAKQNLNPGEIILDETSILTANNRLQDALCDACSADLPKLDSEEAEETIPCPDCEVVFCSQQCFDAAVESYHPALCEMEVEAIAKDVPPAEAAESLYSLLLLRALAMAKTQSCHPLELKEVKYIWGDFTMETDYKYPMTAEEYFSDDVSKTLPFSFEYNIRLPFHMLEKMDVDIFANPQCDVWVFNTLYAKFRGTASARLSGSTGDAIKGPEVGAVHPMWCLANHSCDPNVTWEWGGSIKFQARDLRIMWERNSGATHWTSSGIKKGEEVLNHYCDIELLVHERRAWMRGTLGGDCRCARCRWEAGETDQTPQMNEHPRFLNHGSGL